MIILAVRPKRAGAKVHIFPFLNKTLCDLPVDNSWKEFSWWATEEDVTITCKLCLMRINIKLPQEVTHAT